MDRPVYTFSIGASITDNVFRHIDFPELDRVHFEGCEFDECDIRHAANCTFNNCEFVACSLHDNQFDECLITGTTFCDCDFNKCSMHTSTLKGVLLKYCHGGPGVDIEKVVSMSAINLPPPNPKSLFDSP